jgi:hypothetical protein
LHLGGAVMELGLVGADATEGGIEEEERDRNNPK